MELGAFEQNDVLPSCELTTWDGELQSWVIGFGRGDSIAWPCYSERLAAAS